MPTIEPATPTGRYVLEEWENEGGPDPQMRKAILAIEAEAAAPDPVGRITVLPPASWAEGAAELLERALYLCSLRIEYAETVRKAITDHLNRSMRAAAPDPVASPAPLDVDRLARALVNAFRDTAKRHWDWLKGDGWPAYSEGPNPDVTQVLRVNEIAADLAAAYESEGQPVAEEAR